MTISYRSALHEADELLDAQMAQTAQTLLALTARRAAEESTEGETIVSDTGAPRHKYQPKLMFQLWHRDANGASPVSYTHLRAHETVLDLVCRLLLEKKQIYNTNIHIQLCTSVYHHGLQVLTLTHKH